MRSLHVLMATVLLCCLKEILPQCTFASMSLLFLSGGKQGICAIFFVLMNMVPKVLFSLCKPLHIT